MHERTNVPPFDAIIALELHEEQITPGKVMATTVENDGHPELLGYTLVEHWNAPSWARTLVKQGDALYIGREPGPPHPEEDWAFAARKGWSTFYNRDCGEDFDPVWFNDREDLLNEAKASGANWVYLYTVGKGWLVWHHEGEPGYWGYVEEWMEGPQPLHEEIADLLESGDHNNLWANYEGPIYQNRGYMDTEDEDQS